MKKVVIPDEQLFEMTDDLEEFMREHDRLMPLVMKAKGTLPPEVLNPPPPQPLPPMRSIDDEWITRE